MDAIKQNIVIAEFLGRTDVAHGPLYTEDLNAMYDAEQQLWDKDWTKRSVFIDHLARILNPIHGYRMQSGWDLLDATAANKAEAFVKTIDKWEDTKS